MKKYIQEFKPAEIGFVNKTDEKSEAPVIVLSMPEENIRPADTYPEIRRSSDLRKILPLEDDDPYFRKYGNMIKELKGDDDQKLFLYEIQSPFLILKDLLDKSRNSGRIYEYLTLDPYSVLLAQDSICVDLINIAVRCMLDGRADGVCLKVSGDELVSDEEYQKFIAPVETHFLDEMNRFGERHILRIHGGAGVKNYDGYPAAVVIMDIDEYL